MELRQLGTSEVKVSPIIFGAMPIGGWLWGGTDTDDALMALKASLDAGVTTIDTAPVYGFGLSEEIVGKAVKGRREKVVIATKTGMRWDRTDGQYFFKTKDQRSGKAHTIYRVLKGDAIIEECELSLTRLGVETIDLYQCHWPDNTTPLEETMEAMLRLKEQGKIRAIGVSNFTAEMLEACLKLGPLASDQPKYNLLDRRIEKDVLPFCRKQAIGLIVYNPLEMGLLTGKVTMDRTFPEGDQRNQAYLSWFRLENRKRVLDALEKLCPIAGDHGMTLAQLVINWTIGEPGITSAIVGARTPQQAKENAEAASFALSDGERALIRKTFEALGQPA